MVGETNAYEEISLLDVLDFFVNGWKTLLSIGFISTAIGVVVSLDERDQFEAKGVIESAKIGNWTSSDHGGQLVEPAEVLASKMRFSTYYNTEKLTACVGEGEVGNLEAIVNVFNPTVQRNTNFVSVVYRAESKDKALKCLDQILATVLENQTELLSGNIGSIMLTLEKNKKVATEFRESVKKMESLINVKRQMEVEELRAFSILNATVHELKLQLMAIELNISNIERALAPPYTQEAKFVTPVVVKEQRAASRRSQIIIISAMVGLFFGVIVLLLGRLFVNIKNEREERL